MSDTLTNLDRGKFLAVLVLTVLLALSGCTGPSGNGGKNITRLSWHAGGTGGTYFPLSNEIKQLVEENSDFKLQVQSTGASVENIGSLKRGRADFALVQNDIVYFAKNGTAIDPFKDHPVRNIRGVATLYPETITIVTLRETGIKEPVDLRNKRINTGNLGSGTHVNAVQILEALGISEYEEQNAGFATAAKQLKNGDIDAAFVVGGWPVGAVSDLANTNEVKIVEIKGNNRRKVLNAAPFYARNSIPSGTYRGVDTTVETVSVQAMITTRSGLDASTVEDVTRAIFENLDRITIKRNFISKESARNGMSIEMHEGARSYFGL